MSIFKLEMTKRNEHIKKAGNFLIVLIMLFKLFLNFYKKVMKMGLIKSLKGVFSFEKDEDFFDKEATIKEYFAVVPPEERKKVNNYDELYQEALKYVSKQSFKDNTADIDNYFYEMDQMDGTIAVLIGLFAYKLACVTDEKGKEFESNVDKIASKKNLEGKSEIEQNMRKKMQKVLYDDDLRNPYDIRVGGKHRDFGHDMAAFPLKSIPNDTIVIDRRTGAPIAKTVGQLIGKKNGNVSMLEIIWEYYGKTSNSLLKGFFSCVGHTIVHFSKDLLTSEGLPLPFSSLLNRYLGLEGYNPYDEDLLQRYNPIENKFNRKVDSVKGNIKASDLMSLSFIEGMCSLYCKSKNLNEKEEDFKRDIKVLAMGTCITVQMSSMFINNDKHKQSGKKGAPTFVPGAKLNVIMTGVMFKNMIQEMNVITKARKEVNDAYDYELKNGGVKK